MKVCQHDGPDDCDDRTLNNLKNKLPMKRYAVLLELFVAHDEDPPYSWDWDLLCGGTFKWSSLLEDDEEAEDFLATDYELEQRD